MTIYQLLWAIRLQGLAIQVSATPGAEGTAWRIFRIEYIDMTGTFETSIVGELEVADTSEVMSFSPNGNARWADVSVVQTALGS